MSNLSDELTAVPRSRITIPENHSALIVPSDLLPDLKSMLIMLRKGKRLNPEDKFAIRSIAGKLILAVVEAEDGQ